MVHLCCGCSLCVMQESDEDDYFPEQEDEVSDDEEDEVEGAAGPSSSKRPRLEKPSAQVAHSSESD